MPAGDAAATRCKDLHTDDAFADAVDACVGLPVAVRAGFPADAEAGSTGGTFIGFRAVASGVADATNAPHRGPQLRTQPEQALGGSFPMADDRSPLWIWIWAASQMASVCSLHCGVQLPAPLQALALEAQGLPATAVTAGGLLSGSVRAAGQGAIRGSLALRRDG